MKKIAIALFVLFLFLMGFVMDRFVMPSYIHHQESVIVPDVQNMQYDDALRMLQSAGLSGKKRYNVRYLLDIDSNLVIAQHPEKGSAVKPGRTVSLILNKREKPKFSVPDLYGRSLDESRQLLERFTIVLQNIQEQSVVDPDEDGKVLGQSIPPRTVVSSGTPISVIVGKMSEDVAVRKMPVPDVLGMSLKQAREIIEERGFNTGNVFYEYSSILVPYTVISQKPSVNSLAEPGKVVDLTVVIDER